MNNIQNIALNIALLEKLLNLFLHFIYFIKKIYQTLFSTDMQSNSKEENTTISITEEKPDQTAPLKNVDIYEARAITKNDSLKMINNCLTTFSKMIDEGVTIPKCDAINQMFTQILCYIDINIGNIMASDDDLIYLNKEMTELDPNKMICVYELVLWKRINNHLDEQYKLGIVDNINFLRDIKDYIENVCYKNINVNDKKDN